MSELQCTQVSVEELSLVMCGESSRFLLCNGQTQGESQCTNVWSTVMIADRLARRIDVFSSCLAAGLTAESCIVCSFKESQEMLAMRIVDSFNECGRSLIFFFQLSVELIQLKLASTCWTARLDMSVVTRCIWQCNLVWYVKCHFDFDERERYIFVCLFPVLYWQSFGFFGSGEGEILPGRRNDALPRCRWVLIGSLNYSPLKFLN